MAMTSKVKKEPAVTFSRPTVSDRLYIAQGPSGWNETFQRRKLDDELARFLGEAPVDDVVAMFITQRSLNEDKLTTWHTVIGFLGRLLDVSPFEIPPEIGLAFWGRVELAMMAQGTN
jgi:hypothetical protein